MQPTYPTFMLTLSRKVDECKPLPGGPRPQPHHPRDVRAVAPVRGGARGRQRDLPVRPRDDRAGRRRAVVAERGAQLGARRGEQAVDGD